MRRPRDGPNGSGSKTYAEEISNIFAGCRRRIRSERPMWVGLNCIRQPEQR